MSWNLAKNAEINQYNAEDPYCVSFDGEGNVVIVRDGLIDIDDRCTKITAFDFDAEVLEEATQKENRVDDE